MSSDKLTKFSNMHFTYINQIFGDRTVREDIYDSFGGDLKPYTFKVIRSPEFEGSFHHMLKMKKKQKGKIVNLCSALLGYQDIDVNVNDTLCQTYSLMIFMGKLAPDELSQEKIDSIDRKELQHNMVDMYYEIMENKMFMEKLKEIITNPLNGRLWADYTKTEYVIKGKKNCEMNPNLLMDYDTIVANIRKTLEQWKEYGYWHFIGDGVEM